MDSSSSSTETPTDAKSVKDETPKVYKVATSQTIDDLVMEYKRWKSQYAPLPPEIRDAMERKRQVARTASKQREQIDNKNHLKSVIKVSCLIIH